MYYIIQSHSNSLQLLEAIGAISKNDSQKATSRSGNYQDVVTAPISRDDDDDATGQEDSSVHDKISLVIDGSGNILPAVEKVCRYSMLSLLTNLFFSSVKSFVPFDQAHNVSKPGSTNLKHHFEDTMVLIVSAH